MSQTFNESFLRGYVVGKVDYYEGENYKLCKFAIAVKDKFTPKGKKPIYNFIPLALWGPLAPIGKKVKKGDRIAITGEICITTNLKGERKYRNFCVKVEDFHNYGRSPGADDFYAEREAQETLANTLQEKEYDAETDVGEVFF